MRVERDIAGITLPFVVGVGLTLYAGHSSLIRSGWSAALAFSIITAAVLFLLHPCHRHASRLTLRTSAALCLAACGALCGISSGLLTSGIPYLTDHFGRWGIATGHVIDAAGFTDPDTNAIIKALIIGDRSDMPDHITEAFRKSGASHILALSGLHLGIIYGILSKSLSVIGNSSQAKRIRSTLTVIICGLYTLATGAGASITRAFIFILTGEAARLSGRFRSTGSILMTALLIHLVIDPAAIRDVGFQLSYAAMAGVAFIFPWLKGFWPQEVKFRKFRNPLKCIWETVALSISCQITTGPLAYVYFGTFPVHFLLTNLIAMPLTGLIILAAVLTVMLTAAGWCPEMLLRATEALVTALSEALNIIASM